MVPEWTVYHKRTALFGRRAAGTPPAVVGWARENVQVVADFIAAWNARDVEIFREFIPRTKSITMTMKPGSMMARGPMVTHERVDEMNLLDGTTGGSGTWVRAFGLRDRKIVDFTDFQIA